MYKHELRFNRINETFEIQEPFGFDSANFKLKKERHSRSLIIADFDEVELHRYLNHQFELVATEIQLYGWECSIDYILTIDDIVFKVGQIDGLTSNIFKDKVKISITQDSLTTFIKRNENIEINAFSDKDLKGGTIAPCQTTNVFIKPKPINQTSEWGQKLKGYTEVNFSGVMPPVNNLIKFGIQTSFSPYDNNFVGTSTGINAIINSNRLITPKNDLSKINIKIKNLKITNLRTMINGGSGFFLFSMYRFFWVNNDFQGETETFLIPTINLQDNPQNIDVSFDFDIDNLKANENLSFILRAVTCKFDSYSCDGIEITATSTAIGSVIKAIRLKDYIKHKVESMGAVCNDEVFNQPLYIDNFVANGRMIGGFDDLPFHATFKNTLETFTDEAFADYEILENNVNIKPVKDYYLNEESELLKLAPEHKYSIKTNDKLSLNTIEIGFKKSSKDRTGNNESTTDAVHTMAQYKFNSEKTDAIKKIDFDHIRDAFLIEEQRRKANIVEEKTVALENDENVFCIDCIPIAPNYQVSFTRFLRGQIEVPSQIMTLLSDGAFKWTNLGMVVGQAIQVGSTLLQITELTEFALKGLRLNNPVEQTSNFEFTAIITYSLQGVAYMNRTNEGFSLITGIDNPENFGNLNFTLKRIFNRHLEWWLNAGQFLTGKKINVTKIGINDKLQTTLTGGAVVIDNAPFEIVEGGFMSGFVMNCKVFSDFETALNVVENRNKFVSVEVKNGLILSGWVVDFQYNWRTNTTLIDLELTKESFLLGLPYILAKDL